MKFEKKSQGKFYSLEWIYPSIQNEYEEILHQSEDNVWLDTLFPSSQKWIDACNGADIVSIPYRTIKLIDNVDVDLKNLSKEKISRVKDILANGGKIEMPIVLFFIDGYKYLISGNTRLAFCYWNRINPKVLQIAIKQGIKNGKKASQESSSSE